MLLYFKIDLCVCHLERCISMFSKMLNVYVQIDSWIGMMKGNVFFCVSIVDLCTEFIMLCSSPVLDEYKVTNTSHMLECAQFQQRKIIQKFCFRNMNRWYKNAVYCFLFYRKITNSDFLHKFIRVVSKLIAFTMFIFQYFKKIQNSDS